MASDMYSQPNRASQQPATQPTQQQIPPRSTMEPAGGAVPQAAQQTSQQPAAAQLPNQQPIAGQSPATQVPPQRPITQEPAQQPAAQQAAQQPSAQQVSARQPAVQQLPTQQPAAQQPALAGHYQFSSQQLPTDQSTGQHSGRFAGAAQSGQFPNQLEPSTGEVGSSFQSGRDPIQSDLATQPPLGQQSPTGGLR